MCGKLHFYSCQSTIFKLNFSLILTVRFELPFYWSLIIFLDVPSPTLFYASGDISDFFPDQACFDFEGIPEKAWAATVKLLCQVNKYLLYQYFNLSCFI